MDRLALDVYPLSRTEVADSSKEPDVYREPLNKTF